MIAKLLPNKAPASATIEPNEPTSGNVLIRKRATIERHNIAAETDAAPTRNSRHRLVSSTIDRNLPPNIEVVPLPETAG